jgi:hypothetical protein
MAFKTTIRQQFQPYLGFISIAFLLASLFIVLIDFFQLFSDLRTGDKLTPSEEFDMNTAQRCILCHVNIRQIKNQKFKNGFNGLTLFKYPLDTSVNSNLTSSALNNLEFTISISKPKKYYYLDFSDL